MLFLHSEKFTQRRCYTQKPLHREGFTQSSFYTDAFAHRRFYTQKLLRRKAFSKEALPHEAFTQSSFTQSSFTHRRFFTKKFLHTGTLTRRCPSFYTQELLHIHALQKEAFRHRNFAAFSQESFYTEAFAQICLYKRKRLHTEAFTQRSL